MLQTVEQERHNATSSLSANDLNRLLSEMFDAHQASAAQLQLHREQEGRLLAQEAMAGLADVRSAAAEQRAFLRETADSFARGREEEAAERESWPDRRLKEVELAASALASDDPAGAQQLTE